ncbi:hypothetical protein [Streptomyces sp. NPDC094049]|uniref:hypothetical protein n=1 Tax=Streptomyces sp. NPDC094049 TaxID=3154987 RepID=UPI0033187DF9
MATTVGPTEPVAFAREIFARLGAYEGKRDAWYRLFHDSDPAACARPDAREAWRGR